MSLFYDQKTYSYFQSYKYNSSVNSNTSLVVWAFITSFVVGVAVAGGLYLTSIYGINTVGSNIKISLSFYDF